MGWKGGLVRLPTTPLTSPKSCSMTFPSEEGGYLEGTMREGGGDISQARAQGLFWFEFPLSSLSCNMKKEKKEKKKKQQNRKTCLGRHCPQHLLPSLKQHTHYHLLTLLQTHLPLQPQEVLRKPDTNQNMGSDLVPPT